MHIQVNVTQSVSPLWLYFKISEVQAASSPLGPEAGERPSMSKESLSPSSEGEQASLEDMLEHSAMFKFYCHFFSK